MAAPILIQTSKDLAYKLQDPVSAGTANGVRLSADERLQYILRAYRRLLRSVTLLYPELIQTLFNKFYEYATGTSSSIGEITPSNSSEVFEVQIKRSVDNNYQRARFINQEEYIDIANGLNKFFVPDLDNQIYFWTMLDQKIKILPSTTYQYQIMIRRDTAALLASGGYNGSYDLDIPTEFIDIILSAACAEAYLDVGESNLVQAYRQDVNEQLTVLAIKKEKKEKKDEA